jgi:translation initiation factor 1
MSKSHKLVYSTESGPIKDLDTQQDSGESVSRIIKMKREVKGRGGKTVTTLVGFNLPAENLQKVASDLKRHCGSGGSVKDGIIIIQGDQRDKIETYLAGQGYQVRRAGG